MALRDRQKARIAELEKRLKATTEGHYRAFAQSLLPRTADYLLAAWDYQHRPANQLRLSPEDFAARHGLHEFALRQWLAYLAQDDYRLMTRPVIELRPGVKGWASR